MLLSDEYLRRNAKNVAFDFRLNRQVMCVVSVKMTHEDTQLLSSQSQLLIINYLQCLLCSDFKIQNARVASLLSPSVKHEAATKTKRSDQKPNCDLPVIEPNQIQLRNLFRKKM